MREKEGWDAEEGFQTDSSRSPQPRPVVMGPGWMSETDSRAHALGQNGSHLGPRVEPGFLGLVVTTSPPHAVKEVQAAPCVSP